MKSRSLVVASVLALSACDEATPLEPLNPGAFDAVTQTTMLELSAAPAFGDERGGGVFIDLAGRVVRVRANGTRGVLEAHPSNVVLPGPASSVWSLGTSNALVATSRGFFVADQGWLIAPAWQSALSAEGLRATALDGAGVAWLAHEQGLYRLERGVLSEFKLAGASVTGVTALAAAPTLDGTPGLWFARDGRLFSAAQVRVGEFSVQESGLADETLAGGVRGLAGIAPGKGEAGELWAITQRGLLLYTGTAWREYTLPVSPRRLLGAGRVAWLEAGDAVYRYDGDRRAWAEAKGLGGPATLVSVDAAGAAWVRVGQQTLAITPTLAPRVRGVWEGSRVFDAQLVVEATLPASEMPSSVQWQFDDAAPHEVDLTKRVLGSGPTADLQFFSLGGVEPSGHDKPISLGALADGWHTLKVRATTGGAQTERTVHFEFRGASTAVLSWEADVRALGEARCAKCHATGTEPELVTYEQWKANAAAIASAVRDSRMPADGPMDAASVAVIVRWVNGGALP